jgi:hypothetical protein
VTNVDARAERTFVGVGGLHGVTAAFSMTMIMTGVAKTGATLRP